MTSTSELRKLWASYLCEPELYETVAFPGSGRVWNLSVAAPAVEAFQALAGLMESHGYLFRESAGGTYNCRQIAGSDNYSLHAYGIAIDLNPSRNPYGTCTTNMPASFTNAVKDLRTGNGRQVFSWGGDWRPCSSADPMHWQIDCAPGDLATGIGDDMTGDEVREIIRQELDRLLDGRPGPVNGFYGLAGAVATAPIGASNPDTGEATPLPIGGYLQKTYSKTKTIEKKIDELELEAGSGGISSEELSDAILEHAADPDAHHE